MQLLIEIPKHKGTNDQRDLIFFDELVTGYVIIVHETPISHYKLFLDVSIIPGDVDQFGKEFSIINDELNTLVSQTDHETIYEFTYSINYPKNKVINPLIHFAASIKFDTVVEPRQHQPVTNYLPISERNLLQELKLNNNQYTLVQNGKSNGHVEETNNSMNTTEGFSTTSGVTGIMDGYGMLSLPIFSSLVIKLKSTKPAGKNNILLLSFNIESSEVPEDLEFKILGFVIDSKNCKLIDMNDSLHEFPINFTRNESLNLCYKIINNDEDTSKQLGVNLTLKVLGNDFETNVIETKWAPNIDFGLAAPPINHALKSTTPNLNIPMNSKRKPALNKRIVSSIPLNNAKSSASSVTINLNNAGTSNTLNSNTMLGLKLTFNGKLVVKVGEIVTFKLQAINNSPHKLNLSLVVQNLNTSAPTYLGGSFPFSFLNNKYQLYASYSELKLKSTGILILNNDLRLGPLDINSVYETNLKLVGFTKGIHNLEGLKLYDTITGEGLDFGKLVEIYVI